MDQAHNAGVQIGRADERRVSRDATRAIEQQLEAERAARAKAEARAEKAEAAAGTHRMLATSSLDPVSRRKVENRVETARQKAPGKGTAFAHAYEVTRIEHDEKVKAGLPSVAPVNPVGEPMHPSTVGTPARFEQRLADRERYRARLKELGLLDPSTGSVPGGGR